MTGIIILITITIILVVIVVKSFSVPKEQQYETKRKEKLSAEQLGSKGERIVSYILNSDENSGQYLINDILFEDKYGATTQIDHVLINRYGIWVIETKNYSGIIIGLEKQREWIHVVGKKQYKFYNPIIQNQNHINRLSAVLDNPKHIHNVVVFLSNADISSVNSPNVCSTNKLREHVNRNENGEILSPEQIEKYYSRILSLKNNSKINLEDHVQKIKDAQNKIENNVCPRCGGKLVLRKGEFGEFYGCENYPNCKFTKKQ